MRTARLRGDVIMLTPPFRDRGRPPAWEGIESGLPSLPILRSEPRSGNDRVGDQRRFCNIVGGVVSPLLSNIFLHYVLDEWFEREVQPRLKGRSFLIRYADDFVMGFSCEEDARRVMAVLPKRFEKYGLTIHPEKTRLVPFERPDRGREGANSESGPLAGTFDLLGFTHYSARSRKGNWVVKRKTSGSRFRRGLQALSEWCRVNRHQPMEVQRRTLTSTGALSRPYAAEARAESKVSRIGAGSFSRSAPFSSCAKTPSDQIHRRTDVSHLTPVLPGHSMRPIRRSSGKLW